MKSGWQTKPLGELCEIELGKTPARANKAFWDEKRETANVWLSIADLLNAKDNLVIDSKEYLSNRGAAISKIVRKGTLLVSFKLTLGRLAFAGRDLYTNEAIAALNLFNERELSKEFLFYFLHFFDWRKAAENDVKLKGMTLNKAKLKELQVHFPSLPEQQRIVSILDEAFDSIAAAKANAEKNLQNAHALFESQLQANFTKRGEGWVETTLGEVCRFENGDRGKNYPNREEYVESGIPWINTGHIQPDGNLSESDMNFISREKYQSLRSGKIQPGDLVYCLRGATLGKTALVEPFTIGAVASSLVIIRPCDLLDSRFLYYFLTSPVGQGQIKLYDNGAAQPNLGAKSVAKYKILLPKLSEQRAIVQKLAAIAAETQHLKSIYRRKLAALDELKKSLLHQVINGEL
jgi:type I restriction enzyme S subunit